MKPLLLTSLIIITFCIEGQSQFFGGSISYSSSKAFGIDVFFGKNQNRFHLGNTTQSENQKATIIENRSPNHGLKRIGDGDKLNIWDFGYSRIFKEKYSIHCEVGIGSKTTFTNFEDDRFSDGGYSLIDSKDSVYGLGINGGIILGYNFEIFAGYHTLKSFNFGLRYSFNINSFAT